MLTWSIFPCRWVTLIVTVAFRFYDNRWLISSSSFPFLSAVSDSISSLVYDIIYPAPADPWLITDWALATSVSPGNFCLSDIGCNNSRAEFSGTCKYPEPPPPLPIVPGRIAHAFHALHATRHASYLYSVHNIRGLAKRNQWDATPVLKWSAFSFSFELYQQTDQITIDSHILIKNYYPNNVMARDLIRIPSHRSRTHQTFSYLGLGFT